MGSSSLPLRGSTDFPPLAVSHISGREKKESSEWREQWPLSLVEHFEHQKVSWKAKMMECIIPISNFYGPKIWHLYKPV